MKIQLTASILAACVASTSGFVVQQRPAAGPIQSALAAEKQNDMFQEASKSALSFLTASAFAVSAATGPLPANALGETVKTTTSSTTTSTVAKKAAAAPAAKKVDAEKAKAEAEKAKIAKMSGPEKDLYTAKKNSDLAAKTLAEYQKLLSTDKAAYSKAESAVKSAESAASKAGKAYSSAADKLEKAKKSGMPASAVSELSTKACKYFLL